MAQMLGIRDTKRHFFDRAAVKSMMGKKSRRALARFGGLVRKTAQGLIRTRKRSSLPGLPPSSHTGLLRRFIYFFFDQSNQSVIIGPAKLERRRTDKDGLPLGGRTIPETLETGGEIWSAAGRNAKQTFRRVKVAPRPFMGPALAKKSGELPRLFSD